jgi:uncharacterized protein (DUF305 family)
LRRAALAAGVVASVALAGCGGVSGSPFKRAEPVNETDAAFVRAMIAHERSVGTIAELGRDKAMRVELRGIAKATVKRHARDASTLALFQGALRGRRAAPLGARNHSGPPRFDVRTLRRAVSFDHEFMVLMIRQHEYAMAAAQAERERGSDRNIKVLAASVYESSRRDAEQLRRWLRTWYGDDTQPGTPPGSTPAPSPSPSPPTPGSPGRGPEV